MKNKIKIVLLSVSLLTQQSYCIGEKLFVWGYYAFVSLCLPFIFHEDRKQKIEQPPSVQIKRPLENEKSSQEYQAIVREFNEISNTHNKAYAEHIQFLKDRFFSDRPSKKFIDYRDNIIIEFNKAGKQKSVDIKKKNTVQIKNLTSLYSKITECLKVEIAENYVTDKTYDNCFEQALTEQQNSTKN